MADRYPDADSLLADARASTGLDDFGPGDFRAGLDVLLESFERDTDLNPATDAAGVADDLRRRLVNRLEVEAWYADHPEIDELPGARARSTSTGCRARARPRSPNMLSLDPQFRSLRQWEQVQPCPPPTTRGRGHRPRRLQLDRENEQRLAASSRRCTSTRSTRRVEDTWLLGMALPRAAVHGAGVRLPRVVAHGRRAPPRTSTTVAS